MTEPSDTPQAAPPAPVTGHAAIDAALARLESIDQVDVSMHAEEFDAVHGVLRESLANAGHDGSAVAESP